jgi:cytoskeletal protein RodZ
MYAYMYMYKKKTQTSPMCERILSFYEEGKEKEKMLFFFSALRAVVHLEKAISEPAITIQKEKERKKKKSCLYTNQERKKENISTRERKRAITKTNERERARRRTKTHTPSMNGARSLCIYLLETVACFI